MCVKMKYVKIKYMKKKFFCHAIMPSKDTKTLDFGQYQKLNKAPFIIYANIECIIEQM